MTGRLLCALTLLCAGLILCAPVLARWHSC